MSTGDGDRSDELDLVRALLFPHLPTERGWALIDAAEQGQRDDRRWERIEAIASRERLLLDLYGETPN